MTYVKICGLTTIDDALAAADAGADYFGFIFVPNSPRAVTPSQVRTIVAALPPEARTVGVFINMTAEYIDGIRLYTGLMYAQLHGDEPPQTVSSLEQAYKALRPSTIEQVPDLLTLYKTDSLPGGLMPSLLIDTYHPTLPGGTGQQISRDIAQAAMRYTPRLMLAGGLTPDTVADVVREVHPFAVDVSSGVEATPGKKDHGKLTAFIQSAHEATRQLEVADHGEIA